MSKRKKVKSELLNSPEYEDTEKSGLKIVILPAKHLQSVSFRIVVRTGSRYETDKTIEAAHFMEHMCFKGTTQRTSKDITTKLDQLGVSYNAATYPELTIYTGTTDNENLKESLDIFADMLKNSKMTAKDMKIEANTVTQELTTIVQTPSDYVEQLLLESVFKGNTLGLPIQRTIHSSKNIKLKNMRDFYNQYYIPSNMTVIIAGNIDSTVSNLLEFIKTKFKKFKKKNRPELPKSYPLPHDLFKITQDKPRYKNHPFKGDQVELAIGFPIQIGIGDPEKLIVEIITDIMGGGLSSRLDMALRDKKGYTYKISCSEDFNMECGMVYILASMDTKDLIPSLNIIAKELKAIRSLKPITAKEFKNSRTGMVNSFKRMADSSSFVADLLVNQVLYDEKRRGLKQELDSYNKIKFKDVKKLSTEIFNFNHMNVITIGPKSIEKKVEKIVLNKKLWE
jgi:predicted Zn-dependent peptidase